MVKYVGLNAIKRKIKFENYKNYLEATKLENNIKHLDKNKFDIDSFFSNKRKYKEFWKNNKIMLKTQRRFKSESHNIFIEEIDKIHLILNEDKRMQSIDWIETYAYGTSKDLVTEKGEVKCNNIIKRYNKWLILMILQEKKQKNITQIGHKFLIIYMEYL